MKTPAIKTTKLSDDELITLNLLIRQLDDKTPRNIMRASYYDGKRAAKQVGGVIPPQYANLAMALGWTAKGVDGLGRRCNIDRFIWPGHTAADLDSLGMRELQDDNSLLTELAQGRTDSLINGVSYLVTTQGMPGEPKALVHARNALNATGIHDARTRRLDSFLSVTERRDNAITGFVLYLPNLTISGEKAKGTGRWTIDRSEHLYGMPVEPLVYKPGSDRRMGRSRITRPAMSHQDAALRALIRMEAHMDIYAIPKMVLLGGSSKMFQNADGTMKSAWQLVMGRIWAIPDNEDAENEDERRADFKQVSPESPAAHLAQLNALAKLEAREYDLPDSSFALTDMANPTAEGSYIQGRDDLIAEAENATGEWSIPTRRANLRALAMQNGLAEVPDEWKSIAPKWRNPLYLSKSAQADAGSKQLASVPWLAETDVGLELIGLDDQQVTRALEQRRRSAGRSVLAALAAKTTPQGAQSGDTAADPTGTEPRS